MGGGEVLLGILLGKLPVITQNLGNANFASLLSSGVLQWRLRKPAEIRLSGFPQHVAVASLARRKGGRGNCTCLLQKRPAVTF